MTENRDPSPHPYAPDHYPAPPFPPVQPQPHQPQAAYEPQATQVPDAPKPRRRVATVLAAAAVLVATAGASGAGGAAIALRLDDRPAAVTSSAVVTGSGTAAPTSQLAKVAAAVQPTVVSIAVTGGGQSGEGSGVILRSDGTILTNNHVVDAAAAGGSITVRFADGRSRPASIVGRAPADDLAVIRAENTSGLTPATLGTNDSLHVGDTVLALGSPLGLEGSVTSGIVSALNRAIRLGNSSTPVDGGEPTVVQALQTDAAINPGNSGGPLVDAQGRIVGITTAIASLGARSGQSGSIGLGFAIPIDSAKRIADSLAAGKQPTHAALGVQVSDAPAGGAAISRVTAGSAADTAGIRSGDVVTAIDGAQITDSTALRASVRSHAPGDKVTVVYTRGSDTRRVTVTLGTANA